MWWQKAKVPRNVKTYCSIVRLVKRRRLRCSKPVNLSNLPLSGCRAFVLDQTLSRRSSRSDCAEGRKKRVGLPELRRNKRNCEHEQVRQKCQHRQLSGWKKNPELVNKWVTLVHVTELDVLLVLHDRIDGDIGGDMDLLALTRHSCL